MILQLGSPVSFVLVVALGLVVVTTYSAIEVVDATETRVLEVFGEYQGVLEPGINVVPPFVSQTHAYDRRTQQLTIDLADAVWGSGQMPGVADVYFEVVDPSEFFAETPDERRLVREATEEALRDALDGRTAAEVTDERSTVERSFGRQLADALDGTGIRLADVELRFPEQDDGSTTSDAVVSE